MKNKMKKSILALAICGGLIGGAGIATIKNKPSISVAQAEYTLINEMEEAYVINSSITIPDTAIIQIDANTQIQANKGQIIFPNGVVRDCGTHLLSEIGQYTIIYFAEYNGEVISAQKTFRVQETSWSYSKSQATYGAFEWEEIEGEGINLHLVEGEMFVLNEVVDISNRDLFEICQIFPEIRKEEKSTPVAQTVIVRLIDAYDETNYIDFQCYTANVAVATAYAMAGSSTQELSAVVNGVSKGGQVMTYDGQESTRFTAGRYDNSKVYGKYILGGGNVWNDRVIARGGLRFLYEPSSHKVYHRDNKDSFITDLDSSEIYPGTEFKGFTTGEVKIGIQCYNYTKGSMYIGIKSLLGLTGEELKNNILIDTVKPVLTSGIDLTDEKGIYGSINEPVTIPSVTVMDLNYDGNLKTDVYYNYSSDKPINVCVKNGEFIPDRKGIYSIVYKATDLNGNVGTYVLDVYVNDAQPVISYEPNPIEKMVAGEECTFPLITATGINKTVECEFTITAPDGMIYKIEDSYSYFPETLGEYEITYRFFDNCNSRVYSYKITCVNENKMYFKGRPLLAPTFIKGATYSFEPYNIYRVTENGITSEITKLEISKDNGSYQEVSYGTNYVITASRNLKFRYSYNGYVVEYERSVVDINFNSTKDKSQYFVGNYSTVEVNPLAFRYNFDGTDEKGRLAFINLISSHNFYLNFTVPETKANYNSISVILTDAYNEQNYIVISYTYYTKDSTTYSVREYEDGKLLSDKKFVINTPFAQMREIQYKGGSLNCAGYSVDIDMFSTDYCTLVIELNGIVGESMVQIQRINNQNTNKNSKDADPQIYLSKVSGVRNVGEICRIDSAVLSSVFNPVIEKNLKLTVIDPDGEIVKDEQGNYLNEIEGAESYDIKLLQNGQYKVIYRMTVYNGSSVIESEEFYFINVGDVTPPMIEFEGGVNETSLIRVKLGTNYKLRGFAISDNDTKNEDIATGIFIYTDKDFYLAMNVSEYVFVEEGYYKIMVWCMDKNGNVARAYYNVLVEA